MSSDPRLADARALIRRIRVRDLYRLVDETVLPVDSNLSNVTAKQILDCHVPSRDELNEDDLILQNLKINYAMQDVSKREKKRTEEKYRGVGVKRNDGSNNAVMLLINLSRVDAYEYIYV